VCVKEKAGKLQLERFSQTLITPSKYPVTSPIVTSQQKILNPKVSGLLKIETRRLSASLQGLNSSLALSVGKL